MEYKSWAGEIKAVAGSNGGFEGYGSLFSIRDDGGDIVEPGAFTDALPGFILNGFISDGHNWESVPAGAIGTIVDARQDDRGLWLKAEYHSTPSAQAARTVAQERMARGKSVGLSIGYGVPPGGTEMAEDGVTRRLLKIQPLFEVAQVNVPMLRPAGLTAVKGFEVPFDIHSDNVRVAVEEWLERVRSGSDARWFKEGRPISEARRKRMASVMESLLTGASEIDALLKETEPPPREPKQGEPPTPVDDVLKQLHARFLELDAMHRAVV